MLNLFALNIFAAIFVTGHRVKNLKDIHTTTLTTGWKHKLVGFLLISHIGLQVFLPYSHFITKVSSQYTNLYHLELGSVTYWSLLCQELQMYHKCQATLNINVLIIAIQLHEYYLIEHRINVILFVYQFQIRTCHVSLYRKKCQ